VVITDTVPQYTTFRPGASTAGWVCVPNNNAGSVCTISIGALAAGGSGSVTFAVTVNATLPAGVTQVDNTASIADDGTNGSDPTPGNNTDDDQTPVDATPDLTITKDDGGVSTSPGGTVAYLLVYENVGNQDATGVVISDTVPLYTTFNPAVSTAGWVCVPNNNAGSTCTISIGALAVGGSGSVTFAVTIESPLTAGVDEIDNLAEITDDGTNGSDPTPGNNTDNDQTPVTASPILTIVKTDGVEQVAPGALLTYTLTITNTGDQGASGVQVVDTIPLYTTFVSVSDGGIYDGGTRQVTFPLFTLPAGGSAIRTVTIRVDNPVPEFVTQITNNATVTDDHGNTDDTEDTDVIANAAKNLIGDSLAETVLPEVAIGEVITYEVSLVITPGTVSDLTLVDVMGKGLAFIACEEITDNTGTQLNPEIAFNLVCQSPVVSTEPSGSIDPADAGRRVEFTFGDLTNTGTGDAILTVRYTVVVLDSMDNKRDVPLTNNATWEWNDIPLPVGSQEVVIVEPDMTVEKSVDRTVALPGEIVTFRLEVDPSSASNQDAYDVVLSDRVPSGLIYVPGTMVFVSGVTPTSMNDSAAPNLEFTWDIYPQDGGPTVIEFKARVVSTISGKVITNTANLSWTSLPGYIGEPQTPNNDLSTERFYDPGSDVNIYGANSSISLTVPELPETGFAPGILTEITVQPEGLAYAATNVWLEIPALKVNLPVVGVPFVNGAWDLTWLGQEAGWLEGTAFPSWSGTSGLTAHVYNVDGTPGPFFKLPTLKWGDSIIVHAYGVKYTYQVRYNLIAKPGDLSSLRTEKLSWLTLITCRDYSAARGEFIRRTIIKAVLVKQETER
jgi:LPXTG-site transpeptidase (sortase) family protein